MSAVGAKVITPVPVASERKANPGMEVRPDLAEPLFIVTDLARLNVVADVPEPPHQHIDMSYVVRPRPGSVRGTPAEDHGFIWVAEDQLRREEALPVAARGVDIAVPEDVRVIGLRAIALVRHSAIRA